ncbi:MAG TPA: hypothetical protein VG271_00215, partial [Beijerinckiaceae bacterium]|nr:hypothetical protein [Beijerinckiaceae bacterium]
MPTPDLHPETVRLINLMIGLNPGHQGRVGEPIDMTQVDALALRAAAERFLTANDWHVAPHLAIALARLV